MRMRYWYSLIGICLSTLASGSVSVTVNGSSYTIPQPNEKGWGNNVTSWIQAISSNTLQPTGGTFTLSAELDLGALFGLKSLYYKSRSANPSTAGVFRLSNSDAVGFRNTGNTGNLLLTPNAIDGVLDYNGVSLVGTSLTQTLSNKTFTGTTNFNSVAATGLITAGKGAAGGITIGDNTGSNLAMLRLQGTSTGYNWLIANNNNVIGLEFTPSSTIGGTTYTTPVFNINTSGAVLTGTLQATAFSGPLTGNVTGNCSGTSATFTGSLTGDVVSTAMATTVASVGGSSAANVHLAELLANAATNANTAASIVKRDGSGGFIAGKVVATQLGVGTSSPGKLVEVRTLASSDGIRISDGTYNLGILQRASTLDISTTDATGDIRFNIGGETTTKAMIDSYGNVLAGLTSIPTGFAAATNGHFWNKQPSASLFGYLSIASASDAVTYVGHNGTVGAVGTSYGATAGYTPLVFLTSDLERMRIATDGSVTIGGTLGVTGQITGNITGNLTGNASTVTTNANLTGPITSVGNATSVASQTGTGTKFVMDTSPTLVTPTLGVATATSINKMAITAPATSSTLAVANGKTFTASNTLTLVGTDSTTMTFPTTSATIARTDAANTFTGTQTFSNTVNNSALTASQAVFTDASKNLVSNAITGSGSVVMSASPTLSGTVSFPSSTTMDSIGRLGIGVTTPGTYGRLVNKQAADTTTNGTVVQASGDDTSLLTVYNGTNFGLWATYFTTGAYKPVAIYTSDLQRLQVDVNGNVVMGTAAIATNATNGFFYIETTTGTPTGTPTSYTGRVPMVYDTTNHKICVYDPTTPSWRCSAAM